MFQGQSQNVVFPAPFMGMDNNVSNDVQYAKYLQNMLVSDNNSCMLRYGTRLVAKFPFDENRIFRSQIAVMSHLKVDGNSEKIIYQNYLSKLPYVNIADNVTVEEVEGIINVSKLIIDTTHLEEEQKEFLAKRIYNGVYFYVVQDSLSDGNDISDVIIDLENNKISFRLPFAKDFFDVNEEDLKPAFQLWWERGALYKLEDNILNINPLLEDLDPNVIVSQVNYQGKLLIANGVDPIFVYDGENIERLKGKASVLLKSEIAKNNKVLTFSIPEFFKPEMEKYVVKDSYVTVINPNEGKVIKVDDIAFAPPTDQVVVVTLTLEEVPPDNVRTILYEKDLPAFSFLAVANDRLWALAEGRSELNKFRENHLAMKVYYASDRKSVNGWFNQKTNEIEFIDLSTNSAIPDNLEAIFAFQGKVLFLGRETTQVWSGEDPTTKDDGQNIELPDFSWEMTMPVGILQKTLFVEIPNDVVFLSKYGIIAVSSINQYQQLSISYNFANGINQFLNAQLEFVENDRDYRNLRAFLYPYGRFLGFKLQYHCLIYQLKQNGSWSIFSENFADSRSLFYDPVSQDLFLGMDDGVLLAYADKAKSQTYQEYGRGAMIWRIHYNWIYPNTTWHNESIFISCRTLAPIDINVKVYIDYSDAENFTEIIKVNQSAGLYDNSEFGQVSYSYRDGSFPYEVIRFAADSIMLALSGTASEQLIFDRLFLAGGSVNAN